MTSTTCHPLPTPRVPTGACITNIARPSRDAAHSRAMRPALIDWISRSDCSWALTLNPNRELGLKTELNLVREAFRAADERLLGSRFNRRDGRHRLLGFVFAEHLQSNIHFHIAMRPGLPSTEVEEGERCIALCEAWKCLVPTGSHLVKPVANGDGWGRYISKEFRRDDFEFWTSSMWWPERQRRHVLDRSWEPRGPARCAVQ
jgi:hypothetical protein